MAVVIVDPEMGIYLGNCIGLGFWSKLDAAGQKAAVTFASHQDAEDHMSSWAQGRPAGVRLVEVAPDDGMYASIQACTAAGLEPWDPERVTPEPAMG